MNPNEAEPKSLRTTRRFVRWKKNWILLKKNCPCPSKNWKMLKRLPMNPNEAERSSNPELPRTKNDFKPKKLNFEKPRLSPKKLTENTKKSPENWSWPNPRLLNSKKNSRLSLTT